MSDGTEERMADYMVKGCHKRIYCVKNIGSKYFEEAYLILRSDMNVKKEANTPTDLAKEAERIVNDIYSGFDFGRYTQRHKISRTMSFALGAVSSSALIGIIALMMFMW